MPPCISRHAQISPPPSTPAQYVRAKPSMAYVLISRACKSPQLSSLVRFVQPLPLIGLSKRTRARDNSPSHQYQRLLCQLADERSSVCHESTNDAGVTTIQMPVKFPSGDKCRICAPIGHAAVPDPVPAGCRILSSMDPLATAVSFPAGQHSITYKNPVASGCSS